MASRQWTPTEEFENDMPDVNSPQRFFHQHGQAPSRDDMIIMRSRRSHHADIRLITTPHTAAGQPEHEPNPESYNPQQRSEGGRSMRGEQDERLRACNERVYELEMELEACEKKLQAAEESLTQKDAQLEAEKRRVYLLEQELKQSIYTSSILATTYNKNAQRMIETMEQERGERINAGADRSQHLAWTAPHTDSDTAGKARYSSAAAVPCNSGSMQVLLPNAVEEDQNICVAKRLPQQEVYEDWNNSNDPQWLKKAKFRRQVLTFLQRTCEKELKILQQPILTSTPVIFSALQPQPAESQKMGAPEIEWKRNLSLQASISPSDKSGKMRRRKSRLYDDFVSALQQARGRRGLRKTEWWRDKTLIDQKAQAAALGAACFGVLGFVVAVYQNEIIYSGGDPDDSSVC